MCSLIAWIIFWNSIGNLHDLEYSHCKAEGKSREGSKVMYLAPLNG